MTTQTKEELLKALTELLINSFYDLESVPLNEKIEVLCEHQSKGPIHGQLAIHERNAAIAFESKENCKPEAMKLLRRYGIRGKSSGNPKLKTLSDLVFEIGVLFRAFDKTASNVADSFESNAWVTQQCKLTHENTDTYIVFQLAVAAV